jgi:hypothetical protein
MLEALVVGGRVKRETWAAAFGEVLEQLGAGVRRTATASGVVEARVWIARDGETWAALGVRGDQPAALAACRARGMDAPRARELVAAIADGLAAGLDLRAPMWSATVRLDPANQRLGLVVDPFDGRVARADVAALHAVLCVLR